jgi:hypothetical protein
MRASLAVVSMGVAMVLSVGSASAETSDLYDNFTRCPTSSPAMNDPTATGVVCASSIVRGGLLRVGNFQMPITSPVHTQFALVFKDENLTVVPGSTSMESTPSVLPNPFYVPPATPATTGGPGATQPPGAPAKKGKKKQQKKSKKKGKRKQQKKGKKKVKKHKKKPKKGKKRHKKKPVAAPPATTPPLPPAVVADPFIRITLEPIGDLNELNLGAVFGEGGPLYRLALRMHLEGSGLGPSCYIGTAAEPIELEPVITSEPTQGSIGQDPNGYPVEVLAFDGSALEDGTFAVPGAGGCGVVDPATQRGSLDPQINALVGLPAVSGGSKVIFSNVLFEMAATELDGSPPDGGAQLREAFEAAK